MRLKVKKSREGHQHPDKEGATRLNANVPISFYREVKIYAVANDTNITDMVVAALREYMSK
ncbi:MAG: hypothetical protein RNU03_13050 [Candidatus Sedimenticola sp. (ex Thyasira tokunagai)]